MWEHALRITRDRAAECGFFFDFDGVLSPIQDDPAAVQPVPGALEALTQLAASVRTVGVVSGRPVSFLRGRFGTAPIRLHGLYGMEAVDEHGRLWTDPEVAPFEEAIGAVVRRARAELPGEVLVEDKRLTVGLHYRTAPQHRQVVLDWGQAIAEQLGLRALPGRMVLELAPPVHRDKGDVVRAATEGLTCAWYFGDDLGDLPAMRTLAQKAKADNGFQSVIVAVSNPETGDQIEPLADLVVADPAELVTLLVRLGRDLSPSAGGASPAGAP